MMAGRNQTPEQIARNSIDKRLEESGWSVQEQKKLDWSKSLGIAIKEYPTDTGPADYVLFIDRTAVGVIEAKRDEEAESITEVEEQTSGYANAKLKYIKSLPLPFRYEATGVITRFTDGRDPKPRSREIFSFQRPETLLKMTKEIRSLRDRVDDLPWLEKNNLRDCQFAAISNLELSFRQSHPRALIQMATGAGKTFTAITSVYRLLKYARARRILFLVDTKNLGEQAEQEFMAYTPTDDNRKFTELYNVTRLKSRYIPTDSQVYISTIQRMYSILKGQDLDETAEEMNPNEAGKALRQKVAEVSYNADVPLEFFDFIIVDECHRSIYNLWRQVLEYFDSFLIGLTATPDDRTFGFFNQNVVSEYSHNQAVIDGVNVGYDIYLIETAITKAGAQLKRHEKVYKRERLSRKKRWTQLDEDLTYTGKDLDRDVVNKSQIRTIVKAFKDCVPTLFPGRKETPKTLIFAKTDSHADDIIQIVRDEFGEGSEFCKKITYQTEEDPKSLLASFRNAFNPRVAVTVDMIATGTDVKPLECLLFMRDVRSRNYYTQMLGRGTRTVNEDDFKKVTPSAQTTKTHFIVLDAVGVTSSDKTDMCPLDKKKTESTKSLLQSVLMGDTSEEVFSSLASRLTRLDRIMSDVEHARFNDLSKGHTIQDIIQGLIATHDPDVIQEQAQKKFKISSDSAPTEEQSAQIQTELAKLPQSMLNGQLVDYIEKVKRVHEQVIDDKNIDELVNIGAATQVAESQEKLRTEFEAYIRENIERIDALTIYFKHPHRRKEVTHKMIKGLFEHLKENKPSIAPLRVYSAYADLDKVKYGAVPELTAIVSLIRRIAGIDQKLTPYDEVVNRNFQKWVFGKHKGSAPKFSAEQMTWLQMIKDHVMSSFLTFLKKMDTTKGLVL